MASQRSLSTEHSALAPPAAGPVYWRSLEDYADTPEFRAWVESEFPQMVAELDAPENGGINRRRFLQLMGASMALAGLVAMPGCRQPEYKIRAYNVRPEEVIPGKPLFYATTMVLAGEPLGLLLETHEGRPTKIEGNPSHPSSLGATDAFAQASVLDLYDPERSRAIVHGGRGVRREQLLGALDELREQLGQNGGQGLAVLSEEYASPAMDLLVEHMRQTMPQAQYHVYEPSKLQPMPYEAVYDLERAEVILSLDSDFLGLEDRGIRHKRAFAEGRRLTAAQDSMNRLYVVEPHFTVTGSSADHRLRLAASGVREYAQRLGRALGVQGGMEGQAGYDERWIMEVAEDLRAHAGRCVVIAGRRQPPAVHAMAAQMNQALGNVGQTVQYVQSPQGPGAPGVIQELAERIAAGEVAALVILGGNPAYDAPVELGMRELIEQVPVSVRLGPNADETSAVCTWHVPAAHYLESWGIARGHDGTLSPIQPMIEPLYGGMTPLELLARVTGFQTSEPYEIARLAFAQVVGEEGLEEAWQRFLHEGVWRNGAGLEAASEGELNDWIANPGQDQMIEQGLEICFVIDNSVFDGRFANNGWLQELPDPMTKLTWDNAATLSPRTARELGIAVNGDVLRITLNGRSIEIPAFIMPGHADQSITLPLGYGRTVSGIIGRSVGANTYLLRTSEHPWFATGARVERTGGRVRLASTQEHWTIARHHLHDSAYETRGIVREASLETFRRDPHFVAHMGPHSPPLEDIYTNPLERFKQDPSIHQWGMTIDMTACIGCNACVMACQSENNVPIVGRNEVLKGREMHWLRLDRYFGGPDPEGDVIVSTQPMLCQHCDSAPCEPVCPVNAAVQSPEGLNEQVYNRCVGTRYCANNCPWKVRRFNYFDYSKGTLRESENPHAGEPSTNPFEGYSRPQWSQPAMQETLMMQKNPDVTVRMRGVMEKCTFCVQRLQEAKIAQKVAAGQEMPEKLPDGTVVTACQQSCPTQAIAFGDISDSTSHVRRMSELPHSYWTLEHLNTRPRVWYLGRVRNLNPAMPGGEWLDLPAHNGHGHARLSLPVLGEVRG
jgi:MoCo/4Fe-4S cofactor protein with predicted Tat translocation signal